MFDQLIKYFKSLFTDEPFDASIFADPVALKTEWKPLRNGGANFKTHNLIKPSKIRMEYKVTLTSIFVCYIFIATGIACLVVFLWPTIKNGELGNNADTILPIIFFVIFSGAGCYMKYQMLRPIIFDRQLGYFWKGYKSPTDATQASRMKHSVALKKIRAFQLLKQHNRGTEGRSHHSYRSYQLNIVTYDGSRVTVMNHGDEEQIRKDASKLASFLKVRVWDGIR